MKAGSQPHAEVAWLVQMGPGEQLEVSDLSQVQGLPDVLMSHNVVGPGLSGNLDLKSSFTCHVSPLRDLSEPSFSQL